MLLQTIISGNESDGGFASLLGTNDGKGQGGGIYVAAGATVGADIMSVVSGNNATSSNDDVFGTIGKL
jgi:hypothetical protein